MSLTLWHHCNLLGVAGCNAPLQNGAILTRGECIVWVGAEADVGNVGAGEVSQQVDLQYRWLTPGLIDCHTHLIFAGDRANEYHLRRAGKNYAEIAATGGGILATMRATRAANDEQLYAAAVRRLDRMRAEGVTCIEIKSGYGLDLATETRLLRLARRLGREQPVTVSSSFLGAHALPPEYQDRADQYIDDICANWLPRLAAEGLIDAVDVYCETLGFSLAQAARLFEQANKLALRVRMHAEQFASLGGSGLAASHHALSVDHLEYTTAAEVAALARAGTVAVLLPTAWHYLKEQKKPPVAQLRAAAVPIAIATDCNPGTAPTTSLQLALHFAAQHFELTAEELLNGVTRHAARALALDRSHGQLAVGMRADFAVWDIKGPQEFGYWVGHNPCVATVHGGDLRANI